MHKHLSNFIIYLLKFSVTTADEAATIRVTNLSEDTRESDLQELFRPFGPISRIYLAKDKVTGQSKVSEYYLINILNCPCFWNLWNA
jgi:hypothetical protein